jgi:subtilisin family serine protease
MGWNEFGQLGDGTINNKNKPTKILESNFKSISGGLYYSSFVKEDGSLWITGWSVDQNISKDSVMNLIKVGQNNKKDIKPIFQEISQLGNLPKNYYQVPVEILSFGVQKVSTGYAHSLILKDDGSLWSMGDNSWGQLGDGTWNAKNYPIQILKSGIEQISAHFLHNLIMKKDGSIFAFGDNSSGQLGDGTWDAKNNPIQIIETGVKGISAGGYHSIFLKNDGSLWATGDNSFGQLGDGTWDAKNSPIQIIESNIKEIYAGGLHNFIIKQDNSLWVNGDNQFGQLGDGTWDTKNSPSKLMEVDQICLNGGYLHSFYFKDSEVIEQPIWLSVDLNKGSIDSSESEEVTVTADASQIPEDSATAYIIIESNDPITPKTVVTVTADKLGDGKGLVFIPGKVDFEDTYVGQTEESPLSILNAGTEKVTVSKFVFMNSAFSHHLKLPFDLDAGEKINTTLYFEPNNEGQFDSSALVITSDNEPYKFSLSGKAVMAPALIYSPGQISESLSANEEKTVNFEIKNTGGSPLTWSMKGATPKMGSSFSLGQIFGMEHFAPVEKGAPDSRMGSLISTMGGGPDFHGYSWTDSNDPAGPKHVWNDISKTGDLLTELSEKDDGYKEINLPSSISFYGEDFQKVYVNTNGYLTLGAPSSVHGHFPLPSTMMPNNLIAPMAMDLNPAKGGKIYVEQTEDKLTVQYDKVKDFSGLGEYTFQAVLQSNGVVFFHYHNISEGETKATTGIQNASGDSGLLIAYNNDQITSGMSVRVSTAPKWLHISKSGGTVKAGQSENVEISLKSGMIQNGSYKSVLELTSNDPLKLNSEVPVSLTVKPSKLLTANPTHLNFGEVEVGLSKTLEVTLSNTGNAPIDLSSLQAEDAAFSSNLNSGIIKPGKSKTIEITFKPADGINYQSNSVLSSDADNGPHNISFSGIGLATPKLEIKPEIVTINVDAGSKGSEVAKIDNVKGQAAGTFKLVEIRSGKAGNSLSKFSEDSDSSSETIPADPFSSEHVPNELIVAFRNGANTFENLNNLDNGITILRPIGIAKKPGTGAKALANSSMSLIRNESKLSLSELAKKLAKDPAVEYVEPNYIVRHTGIPNDPKWDKQWALPKIEASKAWDSAVGSDSVIVAVIDTGIDYNHPDLEGNIWKNPGEIAGNNIDDDGNGFVDDIYGWDFCNDDNDPMDGQSHGTHVAGTIAAATNNGELVAGVSWHASLVGIKFLSDSGGGTTADAIDSIAYCAAMEFPISNNSWGGGGYSQALKDVIAEAAQNGHLFCAAAGNSASNNDTLPHYPSNYDLPSIISVAASNSSDKLAWFSCYGLKTVDLAAPGEGILSLVPNGGTATYSGTSMATPHVAGAAALLLSINSDYGHQELKNALMNSVDLISAFEGKMVAPGRLNLANAVGEAKPGWLTVTPDAGTVTAGSQEDLIFSADASEFNAGIKSAVAVFETNDPLATVIEVPVELTVTGSPVIQLSDQSLDFGTVWSNQSETHILEVKNIGTDVLNITAMNFQDGIFSSEINGVILNPGKAQALVITAKPIGSGTVSSTLAISSNDNKNPVTVVDLKVTGMTPPSLTFNPESISLTLEKGLSEDRNVTITNSGEAEGVWDAYLVEVGADKSSQMDLMSALESIASRASVPEVRSPRMLSMNSQQILNLSDPQPVVRFESNPDSSMEVAVLGAAFDYENEDIANGLVATKTFAGVTMVNVSWVTPTLEELSAFDAILVYSIDPYFDAEALGNVVADYAMAGGGVVTASHEGNTHSMEGKWTSEGLNIYPADDNYLNKKESMGDALVEGHPILANVKSFRGNSLHLRKKSPMDGKIIANWSGGTPLVTIREGHSKVADLSFWPVSDLADELGYFPGWDSKTDGWQLIANSLSWSALGNSPDWVTGNPLSGKVTGNSKEEMTLTIDAKNLEEGEYFAEVQFTTNDLVNSFSVVSVHLTVKENQPPVAESITVQGVEDNALDFALVASDPDGDTITYEILGSPTNGTITGKTPQLTYLPNPNFHGKDNLTFKVSDGAADSDVAEVIFEIEAQNDSPIVGSDEINGTEDEFIVIEFNHSDPDGDKLEVQITKLPENGFLWEENGMTLYFPDNHYNGQDEIRFTVSDGEVTSDEATIKINLDPQNDAPVAKELVFQTQQNQTVLITLNAEDVDGDSVSYDLVTLPGHGILKQITNSTWNYTPHEQFTGTDSLLYRANDSMMQSDLAKVSINVNEENNAPVVQDSTFSMQEDGNLPIKLIAADPEGDALTFEIVSAPSNGTLTGNGPKYEYTPDANFNGTDQFTVRANDGKLESNVAKISMLVTAQNDAPSFVKSINTMSSGLRETPYRLRLEVEDVDNDELTISVANNPKYGTCYLQNEELVYLPNPGFEGLEHIVLELSDGKESVQENFPISILSYHSPMEIQIDLEQDPQLLDMLYQANEILSQNGNSIFEVQKPSQGITLTAKLTQNLTNDGQDLNEWLSKLNEGVLEGDFQFLASKMEDGLKWKVAPLLDPASSADTHVNNESSYIEDVVTEKPGSSDTSSDPEPISDKQNSSPTDNRSNYASNPFIQDLGSNWYSAAGIGTFYDAGNGWIYEPNMGWSFLKVCPTNCSAWLFNENLGWLWFSTDLPNMMFSNNTGSSGWIFYPENSLGESQLVFNYTQTAWMQWK